MDDIFTGFKDFKTAFTFLHNHLLPRFLWSGLKLSFKKCLLFMSEVMVLGIHYYFGGISLIKHERSENIINWPRLNNSSEVCHFLGAI